MKLSEIGGALAPIPVMGVDGLYIRADFTWDALKGFDAAAEIDTEYGTNMVTAMVTAEMLLFGDDHKVVTDLEPKANPPLVLGRISTAIVNTLALYGVFVPKRENATVPKPKSSTAKTRTSRRQKAV